MPRKLEYNKGRLYQAQISEFAYRFLIRFSEGRIREPKYRTIDRLINSFRKTEGAEDLLSKMGELIDTIEELKSNRESLMRKVKELGEKDRINTAKIRELEAKLNLQTQRTLD